MYFVKDQTEHIILTGSWFNEDPEVNPLHLIKFRERTENGNLIIPKIF